MLKRPVQQEWLSYAEAKRYSGLSHTTLWRLVTSGEIRAARIGRSVRLHFPSLRDFMERASEEAGGQQGAQQRNMESGPRRLCVSDTESIPVLFDLRLPGAAEELHRARAVWQGDSDIEILGEDHFALIVRPGRARSAAA